MSADKLGIRTPAVWGDLYPYSVEYIEPMEFEIRHDDDGTVIVGASHEDVGLVTYYRFCERDAERALGAAYRWINA